MVFVSYCRIHQVTSYMEVLAQNPFQQVSESVESVFLKVFSSYLSALSHSKYLQA